MPTYILFFAIAFMIGMVTGSLITRLALRDAAQEGEAIRIFGKRYKLRPDL